MITHILQNAAEIGLKALALLGRSPETIEDYRIQFSRILKIAGRAGENAKDPVLFLNTYSQARQAFLNAIFAPRYIQRNYFRSVNLLMLAIQESKVENVAQKFIQQSFPAHRLVQKNIEESLQEFASHLRTQGLREVTIASYVTKTRVFVSYLSEVQSLSDLQDLGPQDIVDGIMLYTKEHSRWANKAISGPKTYFRWLYDKGRIGTDLTPYFRLQFPKWEPDVKYFTPEQVHQLLNALDLSKPDDIMLHAIISLVHYTGMRRTDITNLKIENIDWSQRKIIFLQSKTGRICFLPISDALATSIARYLLYVRPQQAQNFVFVQRNFPFKPYAPNTVSHHFQVLREKVFGQENFQTYGLHALRRGLGTRLLRAGVSLPLIQEVLGHRSDGSNWAYIQADFERLRECCLELPTGSYHE